MFIDLYRVTFQADTLGSGALTFIAHVVNKRTDHRVEQRQAHEEPKKAHAFDTVT